ncbi:hypothetical protein ACQKWADRAFT_310086 [Trichoderma austrokoningii]
MNQIRAIQALNKKEIESGISPDASWHVDYRDTAFVYFGGLPYELSEGDVVTIFSQFGEPVFLKLVRDKETGKSKGFGWLKYEDQRSTDLAVDNLGGAEIGGRLLRVDHARYQVRDDEDQDEYKIGWEDVQRREGKPVSDDEMSEEEEVQRPMLPEERELALLMRDHDDDDPMKGFLIDEKKKETDTDTTDTTTDQDERREMMAEMKDLGGKRDQRKKRDLQRVNQDGKDTEMTRESAIDGTETLLGEIHKSDKGDGIRNPKTGDHMEGMRTAGHTEEMVTDEMATDEMVTDEMVTDEMVTDEMMTEKDAGEREKTTTTAIGEIEADLLGVVKIKPQSKATTILPNRAIAQNIPTSLSKHNYLLLSTQNAKSPSHRN